MAVWLSSGGNHLWNPGQKTPATPWEAEIDELMRRQMVTREYTERKRLFDRVQEIMVENQPLVPLVSPNLLVGAKKGLANFRPAAVEPYTLWNIDQLYWRAGTGSRPVNRHVAGMDQHAPGRGMSDGRRTRVERFAGSL